MKTIWKGSLNFGLVTINIDLYSAVKEHNISFKLLHDKCETPIHNLRWCNHCNQEVSWDHIVKGLPLTKNKFFIMTKEALAQLKPLRSETIRIEAFVDNSLIEPIWLDQHYYACAHKENDPAYALFVKALEVTKKMALARIIFKEKEHLCIIQSYHNALLLSTLHYPHEIRPLPEIKEQRTFSTKELELAEYLIKHLSRTKIAPSFFQDSFLEKLKKAIATYSKKGGIKALPEKKKISKPSKTSLLDILKKSIEESNKSGKSK